MAEVEAEAEKAKAEERMDAEAAAYAARLHAAGLEARALSSGGLSVRSSNNYHLHARDRPHGRGTLSVKQYALAPTQAPACVR